MNAIVLSIGDELVLGQTVDTNSAWLSRELAQLGLDVIGHATVGDDEQAIAAALTEACRKCDYLLISGGLGPTKDDLTRQALARVLDQPLETNEFWLAEMEKMFQRLGRVMGESNRLQAMIPRGARVLKNLAGTAAGIDADYVPSASSRRCRIFAVPGVPTEMRKMFLLSIAPELASTGGGRVIVSRTLHTFGVGESKIGEMLGELMNRSRNPLVGTTVSGAGVSLRITSRQPIRNEAEAKLAEIVAECRRVLGDLIYGVDDQTLAMVVAEMLMRGDGYRVSTAESCTGGLLAKMLTDVPGSSRYFQCGWVTYSNEAKEEMLGVSPATIARFGAVSEETVQEMAKGARQRSGADFGLAISGVAGPDGGTASKPVGTVCIGLAHPSGEFAHTFHFPGDRQMVRERAANMAINLLRYQIDGKRSPF